MTCCDVFLCSSCLRSWLEQDATCPTCRTSIGDAPLAPEHAAPPAQAGPAGDDAEHAPPPVMQEQQLRNHFFHFDGTCVKLTEMHRVHQRQLRTSSVDLCVQSR